MNGRKEMPFYTQKLLSMLGDGKGFYSNSNGDLKQSYKYTPESMNIIYNMFSDEFNFDPSMVNRFNILTKALPKETLSYIKTGKISQELENIKKPLLDIYFNKDSDSQSDLLKAILKYDEENNLYTDEGRKFVQRVTESGLLNQETLRDLYYKKYENKYPYRK